MRQAQFITVATDEASTTTTPSTGLANYSERLEDYIKSLELLSQHVGTRMLRQQRSRTLVSEQDKICHICTKFKDSNNFP
ncbi:MAG: hypothetical protein MJE68_16050 [Proteobacteria bacterium]|nr:hypothetical protein [Pseudomonadota bacterium]